MRTPIAVIAMTAICLAHIPAKDKLPKTVDAAVQLIKAKWLSKEDKNWIQSNPEDVVAAQLHLGFGTRIRNEFGLWGKNAALRKSCGEEHPEACSDIIIRALHKSLRSEMSPEVSKKLSDQTEFVSRLPIHYKGFRDMKTGDWIQSITTQVEAFKQSESARLGTPIDFQIKIVGDPNLQCFTRAEFSEDGRDPVSLTAFLGWFSWRNGFSVKHNPPFLEFHFQKACSWQSRPDGILYGQ